AAGATVIAQRAAGEYLNSETAAQRLKASREELFPWIDEHTRLVPADRWIDGAATLQIGGGINADNAAAWLDAGASHVIVTSWIFREGRLDRDRLAAMLKAVGRRRLVLDLSCRKRGNEYIVVVDRWKTFTDLRLDRETLLRLGDQCDEFLVHAVDVEGLCRGIDSELVSALAEWSERPVTYAGGASSLRDLEEVTRISSGKVDLTIGSALDIFGGTGVRYADVVAFNREQKARQ
ncbi:MAG TPA: phosphoribosylformimino-5-aminoimidazole carboxamide ribotide isomerase, partial [Verrucomicrobiota bacterium]|nr:phosphoribosylformimino-5-aminoimidazole carboxamide ribotide isomerase [Verrucomicrobiota bacterium]